MPAKRLIHDETRTPPVARPPRRCREQWRQVVETHHELVVSDLCEGCDVDEMLDEHAGRVEQMMAVQPDVSDGGEAAEAKPGWSIGRVEREPASIPPILG